MPGLFKVTELWRGGGGRARYHLLYSPRLSFFPFFCKPLLLGIVVLQRNQRILCRERSLSCRLVHSLLENPEAQRPGGTGLCVLCFPNRALLPRVIRSPISPTPNPFLLTVPLKTSLATAVDTLDSMTAGSTSLDFCPWSLICRISCLHTSVITW